MSRAIKIFIGAAQICVTGVHFLFYLCLIFFFPGLIQVKWLVLAALGILSLGFAWTSILVFRRNNRLNRVLYFLSSIWLAIFFQLLLASILSLFIYLIGSSFNIQSNYSDIAAGIYLLAIIFAIFGLINARIIKQVEFDLRLQNLPEHWKGKLVVVLSDLHLGHHFQRSNFANKIVEKISKMQPDIVLIPGDFFDGGDADWQKLAEPFKKLTVKHGVYFASGNHDKYPNDPTYLQHIANAGINIIDERVIEVDGIQLIGIGYHSSESEQTLKNKFDLMKFDPSKPAILLKHVPIPEHIAIAEQAGIQLQLSGHTHRGQVYPFMYITRKLFKGFDYGLKSLNKIFVYTTSGIGTWGPPIRIGTKSEIVKITFK